MGAKRLQSAPPGTVGIGGQLDSPARHAEKQNQTAGETGGDMFHPAHQSEEQAEMYEEFGQYAGCNVLVTGATGFAGRVLVQKLARTGARLRVLARESSNLGELADLDIQWFRGDVCDEEIVQAATRDVHYLFHLAAAFRETHPNEEDYRRVHLYSTQLLAKALVDQPQFRRFLHVSTVGVHGHIESGRADENHRFSPGDSYQKTKLEGELWLRQFGEDTGLPYTVIRPGPMFGPGDMRLLKMYRMISKGFFVVLGDSRGLYHLVHVDDATNLMMLAALREEARSEVFIVMSDDPIRVVDMAKVIAKKIGREVRIIRLPVWPFYIAADICCAICYPLGIAPPLYRRRVDFFTKDRSFDNSKVKRMLGYRFRYDNELGIEETANWYLQNNLIR